MNSSGNKWIVAKREMQKLPKSLVVNFYLLSLLPLIYPAFKKDT